MNVFSLYARVKEIHDKQRKRKGNNMNENTICPLISISVDDCFVPCQGERCAWYVPPVLAPNGGRLIAGHCAVRDLGALPELARGVKGII